MVSEATRLVSKDTHKLLWSAYDHLTSMDEDISDKKTKGVPLEDWEEYYDHQLQTAGKVVDEAIESLAKDLDLSSHH